MKLSNTKAGALIGLAAVVMGGASAVAATSSAKPSNEETAFSLVRSAGSVTAGCLVHAGARVHIKGHGAVETMTIDAHGLPKNTDFDTFITQLPNAPFGISWYQGDLETDKHGNAHQSYVGRFSVETFAVAPGSGPAPVVHTSPIADASTNPAFAPVHEYHVGVWFNSAKDAAAAGCANTVTPFNGEHNAGPQALSTRQFADARGPLRRVKS
ncbi:MAG TPA: hypothetical protein VFE19_06585 [Jatrophihabitantaceae bacterium]|jgi:hypothetical protein|nr:hypothetical protein [Jatrophihabitantaceae bacterium]